MRSWMFADERSCLDRCREVKNWKNNREWTREKNIRKRTASEAVLEVDRRMCISPITAQMHFFACESSMKGGRNVDWWTRLDLKKIIKANDHWVMIIWLLSPFSDHRAGLRRWWACVCRWSLSWSARQQQSSWETAESWKAGAILVICWGRFKKILGDPVRDFEERRSEVESLDCFFKKRSGREQALVAACSVSGLWTF